MIPKFCSCVGDVGEDGAGGRVADGGGGVYLCAYCQLSRAVTSITLLHRSSPSWTLFCTCVTQWGGDTQGAMTCDHNHVTPCYHVTPCDCDQ